MSAEKEGKITNSSKDEKEEHEGGEEEQKEEQKVKCIDCIHLIQTQHYLSQEILGHHCFSIGRQEKYPNQYNFDVLQVKKERICEWFKSLADFKVESAEHAQPISKIQRFVTIMVKWGYDWEVDGTSEEEEEED